MSRGSILVVAWFLVSHSLVADDCNESGIPDPREVDCDENGIPDECDIRSRRLADVNGNLRADICEEKFTYEIRGPDTLHATDSDGRFRGEYVVQMTPFLRNGERGAQGWRIAVAALNFSIVEATVAGTVAARVRDGGLVDGGVEFTNLTIGEGNEGVVSHVVLSATMPITLPVDEPSDVLRIFVEGFVDDEDIGSLEFR
ncbi:MAG: hypothetical protein AAF517_12035, partial [Planctomycetota bacterium]